MMRSLMWTTSWSAWSGDVVVGDQVFMPLLSCGLCVVDQRNRSAAWRWWGPMFQGGTDWRRRNGYGGLVVLQGAGIRSRNRSTWPATA